MIKASHVVDDVLIHAHRKDFGGIYPSISPNSGTKVTFSRPNIVVITVGVG